MKSSGNRRRLRFTASLSRNVGTAYSSARWLSSMTLCPRTKRIRRSITSTGTSWLREVVPGMALFESATSGGEISKISRAGDLWMGLQYPQEIHQILLFAVAVLEPEPLLVEVNHVAQRRRRAVRKI